MEAGLRIRCRHTASFRCRCRCCILTVIRGAGRQDFCVACKLNFKLRRAPILWSKDQEACHAAAPLPPPAPLSRSRVPAACKSGVDACADLVALRYCSDASAAPRSCFLPGQNPGSGTEGYTLKAPFLQFSRVGGAPSDSRSVSCNGFSPQQASRALPKLCCSHKRPGRSPASCGSQRP